MFQKIMNWFYSAFDYLFYLIESFALTLLDIIKEAFYWMYEQVLTFAFSMIQSFDSVINWNPAAYFSSLPPVMINMLGLVGLGTCTQIIISSLIVRFILQTIPFVRWGS